MKIHDELIEIQDDLSILQDQKKQQEALKRFDAFIEKLCELGPYTTESWPISWTEKLWEYAAGVSDDYSNLYINKIDVALEVKSECSEQLEFVKSELMWQKKGVHDHAQNYIKSLVKKYPFNIEFKHTYGHILVSEKSDLKSIEEGLEQYLICINVWKEKRRGLRKTIVNIALRLAESYSNNGEHSKALKLLSKFLRNDFISSAASFNNLLIIKKDSIRNTELLEQRIDGIENKLIIEFDEKLRQERRKTFELLGLFTAAISFILSTVSLTGVINYEYLLPVLISLGLVLIIFVLTISLSLNSNSNILKDFRFYLISVFLLVTILMPILYKNPQQLIAVVFNS